MIRTCRRQDGSGRITYFVNEREVDYLTYAAASRLIDQHIFEATKIDDSLVPF